MLTRIAFMLERGSNRRFSILIEEDGLCIIAQPMKDCHAAKVAVLSDGAGPTADQLVAMAALCREALAINGGVVLEFMHGLSPFAEPTVLPDDRQASLFPVPDPTGQ